MDELIERLRRLAEWPDDYGHATIEDIASEAAAALEAAREDAERLAFLASEPVVEGFVGDKKDIYDYACDAAEESGRAVPSEADMLAGLRRMIDTARKEARNG